jgi:hypothetical protein
MGVCKLEIRTCAYPASENYSSDQTNQRYANKDHINPHFSLF